jgi:uncharacterized protein YlxW (UPF0749 family)
MSADSTAREIAERLAGCFSEATHTYVVDMALGITIDRALRALADDAEARVRQLQEETNELATDCSDYAAQIKALSARLAAVEQALRRMRAEVGGTLAIAEEALREAAGNTNVTVLKLRIAEADAALGDPQ